MYILDSIEIARLNYYLKSLKTDTNLYQKYRSAIDQIENLASQGILDEHELQKLIQSLSALEYDRKTEAIREYKEKTDPASPNKGESMIRYRHEALRHRLLELEKQGFLALLLYITPDYGMKIQKNRAFRREIF